MDPEKRKKKREQHRLWLENDPLNRRLREAIEKHRRLADEKRRSAP